MASAAERKRVLSVSMKLVDKMTPALRTARRALKLTQAAAAKTAKAIIGSFKRLAGVIKGLLNPLNLIKAAFIGIAGTALFRFVSGVAESAFNIDMLSRRLGIGRQALQEYQFIAEKFGLTTESLNVGLQRMTRRIADAAEGNKGLRGALSALNLNAQELVQLSPDKQFEALAEAIAKAGQQGVQILKTFQFFDTEGVGLLQVIEAIAEDGGALDKFKQQARELGVVLTDEAIEQAVKFRDSLFQLRKSFVGLRNVIAVPMMETLTELFDSLKRWIVDNRDDIERWVKVAVANLRFALQSIAAFVTMVRRLVADEEASEILGTVILKIGDLALDVVKETLIAVLKLLKSALVVASAPLVSFFATLGETVGGKFVAGMVKAVALLPFRLVEGLNIGVKKLRDQIPSGVFQGLATQFPIFNFAEQAGEQLDKIQTIAGVGMAALRTSIGAQIDALFTDTEANVKSAEDFLGTMVQKVIETVTSEVSVASATITTAVDNVKTDITELFDDLKAMAEETENEALIAFVARIEELKEELEAAKKAAKQLNTVVGDLPQGQGVGGVPLPLPTQDGGDDSKLHPKSFFEGLSEGFTKWKDALKDVFEAGKDAWADFARTIESGMERLFDGIIDGTLSVKEGFEQMAREVLSLLAKIAAKQIALSVTRFLFPAFGKGAAFSAGKVVAMARGGIVRSPTVFPMADGAGVMGERGPEGVLPLTRTRGGELGVRAEGGGEGSAPIINFNIEATDGDSVKRVLVEQRSTIEDLILSALSSKRSFRETVKGI